MLIFILILLSAFFLMWTFFLTLAHYAFMASGKVHSVITHRKGFSKFLFYRNFESILFATNIGDHLARFGYGVAITSLLLVGLNVTWLGFLVGLLIFLAILLLIGELLPHSWALRAPEKALKFTIGYIAFFLILSLPVSWLFLMISERAIRVHRKRKKESPLEQMKETIVEILQEANVRGKLNASDKKLIEAVIKFKDRIVREVMVPRVDLFALPAETPIRAAAQKLIKEGYSRIPIYRDNIDNIGGVLMFKDILELYMDCVEKKRDPSLLDQSVETMVKGVFYTPETKKVSNLLQEFRTKQMHMAIVVDEYGGTEGVITLEDILEAIVGEIGDEYDVDEELLYSPQPDGGWIVDARMSVLDAEAAFGIQIPQEGDYDTIGGYIFHKIGSIPSKGVIIHHDEFDMEILSSSERNVEKVRITLNLE